MSKKLRLTDLARNRDANIRTDIPLPGQSGQTLRHEDVANLKDVLTVNKGDEQKKTEVLVGQLNPSAVPAYVLAKKYVPKTDRNIATYAKILIALQDGPKTLAQLTKAVEDHKDFVGYMVRGGHLTAHVEG